MSIHSITTVALQEDMAETWTLNSVISPSSPSSICPQLIHFFLLTAQPRLSFTFAFAFVFFSPCPTRREKKLNFLGSTSSSYEIALLACHMHSSQRIDSADYDDPRRRGGNGTCSCPPKRPHSAQPAPPAVFRRGKHRNCANGTETQLSTSQT